MTNRLISTSQARQTARVSKHNVLPYLWLLSIGMLYALLPSPAQAESFRDVGNFEVHYNALHSKQISPAIAQNYGIKRSKNRGLINIAILRKENTENMMTPTEGAITAVWNNNRGQMSSIELRQIKESNAIYYIGDFKIENGERLNFTVSVRPEYQGMSHTIKFHRTFFSD